jgi:hypothetical protein
MAVMLWLKYPLLLYHITIGGYDAVVSMLQSTSVRAAARCAWLGQEPEWRKLLTMLNAIFTYPLRCNSQFGERIQAALDAASDVYATQVAARRTVLALLVRVPDLASLLSNADLRVNILKRVAAGRTFEFGLCGESVSVVT